MQSTHEIALSEADVSRAIERYLREQGRIPKSATHIAVEYEIVRGFCRSRINVKAVLTEK